jgi:hypothetical protein
MDANELFLGFGSEFVEHPIEPGLLAIFVLVLLLVLEALPTEFGPPDY